MATRGSSIYKASDLIYDYCCSKCEQNDLNTEAQHFCPECGHYMCEKCVCLHNGYHNNHTVYGRGDIEQWMGSSIDRFDQHGKELEVHCDDHQELCCSVCAALNHRSCNSISHLPVLAKGFDKTSEFRELSAAVDKMGSSLDELKKSRTKYQDEFQDLYENMVAEIKYLRKKIDSILDQIERATIEQQDNTIEDLENDVRDDVEKCVNMNEQLKNMIKIIYQMIGKHKETNSYIGYRKCTAKLTQANNLICEIQRKPKEEIRFEFDKTIESFFKNLKTFGFIEVIGSKQFNVKMKQDNTVCTISGICVLTSGHIVISDCLNNKIKLLNSHFQVIDHCDLSASPNDVCHIAASEVTAATSDIHENKQEVQFIKVTQGRLQKKEKVHNKSSYMLLYRSPQGPALCGIQDCPVPVQN